MQNDSARELKRLQHFLSSTFDPCCPPAQRGEVLQPSVCFGGSRAKLLPYTNFYVEVLTQFWIKLLHVEVLTKVWIKLLHVEVLTIFLDKTSTLNK